jgi:hypothetical protein
MITIDFETYYSADFSLTKVTTEEYVRSDLFEVIGVAVKVNDAPAEWFSGSLEETAEWLAGFDWPNHFVLAHNAMFDAAILTWVFGQRPKAWLDTLSMARATLGPNAKVGLAALVEEAVEVGDIVRLLLQRNKPRYDGYEAQRRKCPTLRPVSMCSATFLVEQSRLPTPGREFVRGICSAAHTPLQFSTIPLPRAPRGASSNFLSMYDAAVATGAARSN